jgi:hypothetical protein
VKQIRLTRIQVLIAGAAIAVGLAVLFFLFFIRPVNTRTNRINGWAAEEEEVAARLSTVRAQLATAEEEERVVTASYDEIMETRMPDISLEDPIVAMFDLWHLPAEEGEVIQRWFTSTGARVDGYSFPAFGTVPPPQDWRILPPLNWTLSVQVEDFPTLLEWLQKIPEAPRFLELHTVTIQGSRQPGQPLTASIPVTMYLWTKGYQAVVVAAAAEGGEGGGRAGGQTLMERRGGGRAGMTRGGPPGGRGGAAAAE